MSYDMHCIVYSTWMLVMLQLLLLRAVFCVSIVVSRHVAIEMT